jgi:hypothetical protein
MSQIPFTATNAYLVAGNYLGYLRAGNVPGPNGVPLGSFGTVMVGTGGPGGGQSFYKMRNTGSTLTVSVASGYAGYTGGYPTAGYPTAGYPTTGYPVAGTGTGTTVTGSIQLSSYDQQIVMQMAGQLGGGYYGSTMFPNLSAYPQAGYPTVGYPQAGYPAGYPNYAGQQLCITGLALTGYLDASRGIVNTSTVYLYLNGAAGVVAGATPRGVALDF